MVVINLTFFTQLGLFLLFLAIMHIAVIRPALRVLDSRRQRVQEDHAQAEKDTQLARIAERNYAGELAASRRESAQRIAQAHRMAQEKFKATLAEQHKRAEQQVGQVRASALEQVRTERADYDALSPQLAKAMMDRLGIGGGQK